MEKNEFDQYRYFKGEEKNPFEHPGLNYWWEWEHDHYHNIHEETFEEYIKGYFQKHGETDEKVLAYRWQKYLDGEI